MQTRRGAAEEGGGAAGDREQRQMAMHRAREYAQARGHTAHSSHGARCVLWRPNESLASPVVCDDVFCFAAVHIGPPHHSRDCLELSRGCSANPLTAPITQFGPAS